MNPRHSKSFVFSFWLQSYILLILLQTGSEIVAILNGVSFLKLHALFITAPNLILLFIQNICRFLSGLNSPANSSKSATFDQMWEILTDINTINVNCTDIDS